jgi:hypothetical protein
MVFLPFLPCSLHHRAQTGSGAHPASYPMGTSGSFPGGKSGRAVFNRVCSCGIVSLFDLLQGCYISYKNNIFNCKKLGIME